LPGVLLAAARVLEHGAESLPILNRLGATTLMWATRR
jgi:hypothetical protein